MVRHDAVSLVVPHFSADVATAAQKFVAADEGATDAAASAEQVPRTPPPRTVLQSFLSTQLEMRPTMSERSFGSVAALLFWHEFSHVV